MDAVQQANSGHPGTPMALAPVAYCFWQRFLRFDPDDPIWPNRDRFVLSAGHASMLLYSLLHLTGVKAVNPNTRRWASCGHAGRHQAVPPARQQMPRPSGIPLDLRRRDHDRPAGPGRGDQRGHGDRRASGWPRISTARTLNCSITTSTPSAATADMMEGVSGEAASLAGHSGSPISAGSTTTTTSRSRATPSWRSAKTSRRVSWATAGTSRASATPTTWSMLDRALQHRSSARRPADVDHRRQPHRLRRAQQAGHQRRPRRTAGRRGDPADQARLRLAGRREIPGSRRGARTFAARHRASAGTSCATAWDAKFDAIQDKVSRAGRPAYADAAPATCPTAGTRTCRPFPPIPKGMARRDSSAKVLNAMAQERALADRRCGGSGALDQDAPHVRGRGRFQADSYGGRNLHFGIREHAMGAILNGLSLSQGPALRLRAS